MKSMILTAVDLVRNKSSQITNTNLVQPEEIKKWMDQHGKPVSKAQAGKISETMDVTGDEKISYEEFLTMIAARLLVLKLQN